MLLVTRCSSTHNIPMPIPMRETGWYFVGGIPVSCSLFTNFRELFFMENPFVLSVWYSTTVCKAIPTIWMFPYHIIHSWKQMFTVGMNFAGWCLALSIMWTTLMKPTKIMKTFLLSWWTPMLYQSVNLRSSYWIDLFALLFTLFD